MKPARLFEELKNLALNPQDFEPDREALGEGYVPVMACGGLGGGFFFTSLVFFSASLQPTGNVASTLLLSLSSFVVGILLGSFSTTFFWFTGSLLYFVLASLLGGRDTPFGEFMENESVFFALSAVSAGALSLIMGILVLINIDLGMILGAFAFLVLIIYLTYVQSNLLGKYAKLSFAKSVFASAFPTICVVTWFVLVAISMMAQNI